MLSDHFCGDTWKKQGMALGSYVFISTASVVLATKRCLPNSECLQSAKVFIILNLGKNNGKKILLYIIICADIYPRNIISVLCYRHIVDAPSILKFF